MMHLHYAVCNSCLCKRFKFAIIVLAGCAGVQMPDGKVLHPRLPVQALGSSQAHLQGCVPARRHHPGAGAGLHAQLDLAAHSQLALESQRAGADEPSQRRAVSVFFLSTYREIAKDRVCTGLCDTERESVSGSKSSLERACIHKTSE